MYLSNIWAKDIITIHIAYMQTFSTDKKKDCNLKFICNIHTILQRKPKRCINAVESEYCYSFKYS